MRRRLGPVLTRAGSVGCALVLAAMLPLPAAAHGPDPRLSGALWSQDQAVGYAWRTGQVPPDWMAAAIDAAASDVGGSRRARAATFFRTSSAGSLVAYGEPTGCSSAGIACFDRSGAPSTFRMWFRANGYRFDWGTLRWCQAPSSLSDGCFDAETIALDELGHVEILDHHVNYADASDYTDAVVQGGSHARPQAGWNQHTLGRCDVARLQLEYDRITLADLISTCVAVPTATSLSADYTSVGSGSPVRFTASLRTSTDAVTYRALAGDPLAGRAVHLQRRLPGAVAWSTVATMTPSSGSPGTYVTTLTLTTSYEWRASFVASNEGALSSTSGALTVWVYACAGRSLSCPTV